MSTHRYTHLDGIVDDVHALIDSWSEDGRLSPALSSDGEIVLRLAIHEWIANLVQHASFVETPPEITVQLDVFDHAVQIIIEDTSCGFDLLGQIESQQTVLEAPAPSERGRGLLMLITCTEELEYTPAGAGRQRLSFQLRNPPDAVFAGLFRNEDVVHNPETDPFDPLVLSGDGLPSSPTPPHPNA